MILAGCTLLLSVLYQSAHALVVSPRESILKRDAIPDYAITYAPYAYLYSGEDLFPSDITTHLEHTTPQINFVAVGGSQTVKQLNTVGTDAFLTSNDNVEDLPAWLASTDYKPDSSGYSKAPATLIAIEKEGGIVDVFYFYFYSYNRGNTVLGIRFGNHVGDWEHTMVRFVNSSPQFVYLSAHSGGSSYTYAGIDKLNGHPKIYIATGSHANYATVGQHDYTLPFGLLHDTTDEGTLWDATKNYRGFWYDGKTFSSAGGADIGGGKQDGEGVEWLYWLGKWGDQQYPDDDDRQYGIFGQYHYVSGPTGPVDKTLTRGNVCPSDDCTIQDSTGLQPEAGVAADADGTVYDEYADELKAFKEELEDRQASYNL